MRERIAIVELQLARTAAWLNAGNLLLMRRAQAQGWSPTAGRVWTLTGCGAATPHPAVPPKASHTAAIEVTVTEEKRDHECPRCRSEWSMTPTDALAGCPTCGAALDLRRRSLAEILTALSYLSRGPME